MTNLSVTLAILALTCANIAAAAASSQVQANPPAMKNIGYLALGYNIFKGDPKNT